MDWGKFSETILSDIGELFTESLKSYTKEAEKDARKFLEDAKNDIEKWTIELTKGELTKKQYEKLVRGKEDVAEMLYLKHKGIGKIETEKFLNGLIEKIIKSAFSLLP